MDGFQDEWEAMEFLLRWWLICATFNINFWSTLFSTVLFSARSYLFLSLIMVRGVYCQFATEWELFFYLPRRRGKHCQSIHIVISYFKLSTIIRWVSFLYWVDEYCISSNIFKMYLFTTFHKKKNVEVR